MTIPPNWTPEQRAELIAAVCRQVDDIDAETLALMRTMLGLLELPDTREIRMALVLGTALAMVA